MLKYIAPNKTYDIMKKILVIDMLFVFCCSCIAQSEEFRQLEDSYKKEIKLPAVTSEINICRDKKDNFLLSLCVDSQADYLLTGDEDLLVIKKIKKTSIIKIGEYLRK